MSEPVVYLNGDTTPIGDARIPVMDRGFLFGDGVYEVIPVFGESILRLAEHLQRLENSLSRTSIQNPHTDNEWGELFERLLALNPGQQRAIYLQITRGVYQRRDIASGEDVPPTVFIMVMQIAPVDARTLSDGLSAVTVEDFRWHACDIKSISLIANVMMKREATDADALDAILVRDGKVTEGTASNLFIVRDGVMITPPKSEYLLPGITRDLVLEIAQQESMPFEERQIEESELFVADEIWLTSSTREIAPVVELDGRVIADGKAGPVWSRMVELYQQYKKQLQAS